MLRHTLLAASLLAFATPAFAQVSTTDPETMEEGVEMMKDGAEMIEEGAEMVEEATDADMAAPVMATPVMEAPTMEDGTVVERVEIACPEGTTAQPDGTCMMPAGSEMPEG